MREIVLDTETTGLDPKDGHRIVEIAGVELANTLPTGRIYHQYINPEMAMPAEAFQIHGLGDAFLKDQPVFSGIVEAFLAFVGSDPLVIHNAEFDMRMINAELQRLGRQALPNSQAIDTLGMAKRAFPGAQASLDALCRRFGVDNSARKKHGALLDCELLAEVYLELQGGRQRGLALASSGSRAEGGKIRGVADVATVRREMPLPSRLTEAEIEAHAAFIDDLGDTALWKAVGEV